MQDLPTFEKERQSLWILQISLLENKENLATFSMSLVKIKSIEEKNGAINLIQRIAIEFHQINSGDSFDDARQKTHGTIHCIYAR
jgi:hypothetical protein